MIEVLGSCSKCLAPIGVDFPLFTSGPTNLSRHYLHLSLLNDQSVNCDAWEPLRQIHAGAEMIPFQGWSVELKSKRQPY